MQTLDNLRTFVVVVRAGSFAAAARQLDISPAMIGRRIAALEEHYGTRLIERTTRSHRLTEAGEAFLARAEVLVEAADHLEEAARGERAELAGRIRLSGPTTLGIRRLSPILAGFRMAHPGVVVEMSLSDRQVDLVAEGYDLAVRIGNLAPASLIARRIGSYRFAVCASPQWVAANGRLQAPDELARHECILNLNMRPRNKWPFRTPTGEDILVEVSGGLEIDNGEAQREAAIGGAGIVYLPLELVGDDIAGGRLIQLLPEWPTMVMPVYLVHATRRLVPARVRALMEAIADGMKAG